jgi:hypothetical protein
MKVTIHVAYFSVMVQCNVIGVYLPTYHTTRFHNPEDTYYAGSTVEVIAVYWT